MLRPPFKSTAAAILLAAVIISAMKGDWFSASVLSLFGLEFGVTELSRVRRRQLSR